MKYQDLQPKYYILKCARKNCFIRNACSEVSITRFDLRINFIHLLIHYFKILFETLVEQKRVKMQVALFLTQGLCNDHKIQLV